MKNFQWKRKKYQDISKIISVNFMKRSINLNLLKNKEILKFFTCGSVDDGKSTLIGRLLFETGSLYEDEVQSLSIDTSKTSNNDINFSHLLDGLSSEREQNITIDVAYRFFATKKKNI